MAAYIAKNDEERQSFRVSIIRLLQKTGIDNENNGDMNSALHNLIMRLEE
jgi:hypothetical protein